MADQVIKITSSRNQTFTANLTVDGSTLTLTITLIFAEMSNYWVMSIYNMGGTLLVDSIPLIAGYFPANNLLGAYEYLHIGSAYLVNISNTGEEYPSQGTLATDWQLIWNDTGRA
jgi:hypothetical protein